MAGPGYYEISGFAWSGGERFAESKFPPITVRRGPIRSCRTPWLARPIRASYFPGIWTGEEVVLQSRSTDERNEVQPTRDEISRIWHIGEDYYNTSTNLIGHFNAIQPWKINRDGSVLNALFL